MRTTTPAATTTSQNSPHGPLRWIPALQLRKAHRFAVNIKEARPGKLAIREAKGSPWRRYAPPEALPVVRIRRVRPTHRRSQPQRVPLRRLPIRRRHLDVDVSRAYHHKKKKKHTHNNERKSATTSPCLHTAVTRPLRGRAGGGLQRSRFGTQTSAGDHTPPLEGTGFLPTSTVESLWLGARVIRTFVAFGACGTAGQSFRQAPGQATNFVALKKRRSHVDKRGKGERVFTCSLLHKKEEGAKGFAPRPQCRSCGAG